MKSDLPKSFKEGDELTASLVNDILEEIWRWRHMEAMPPLHVSEVDSDQSPVLSTSLVFWNFSWGTTGVGFSAGTITSPSGPVDVTLYNDHGPGKGQDAQTATTPAYNAYVGTVAAGKTALFGQTPQGTWYVITADC